MRDGARQRQSQVRRQRAKTGGGELQQVDRSADAAWDDRAEQDARSLVALLFVAGGMRRTELSEALRLSSGRLDRACAFLNVSPPHGLALLESGDRIELVSVADCGPVIERFMNRPAPEPLSQAAMEVLSIVAYEQPISRAEISHIRGTDSSGVIETLLARRLIEDDPRFGGRGARRIWRRPLTFCAHLAWARSPSFRRDPFCPQAFCKRSGVYYQD